MLVQLNMTPGTKGLKKLLGTVPSWITFQEKEKVEVGPAPTPPDSQKPSMCEQRPLQPWLTLGTGAQTSLRRTPARVWRGWLWVSASCHAGPVLPPVPENAGLGS